MARIRIIYLLDDNDRASLVLSLHRTIAATECAEAASALDRELAREVSAVMKTRTIEHMTMVIIPHEMGFAEAVRHRAPFTDRGVTAEGPPSGILRNPDNERRQNSVKKHLATANR